MGKVLTFCHAVQNHVDENVGASPPRTITETEDGVRLSSAQDPADKGKRGGDMKAWGREDTGRATRIGSERVSVN